MDTIFGMFSFQHSLDVIHRKREGNALYSLFVPIPMISEYDFRKPRVKNSKYMNIKLNACLFCLLPHLSLIVVFHRRYAHVSLFEKKNQFLS